MGDWSYPNDDGMGLMEYLDLIEDLGIEGIMGSCLLHPTARLERIWNMLTLGLSSSSSLQVFGLVSGLWFDDLILELNHLIFAQG